MVGDKIVAALVHRLDIGVALSGLGDFLVLNALHRHLAETVVHASGGDFFDDVTNCEVSDEVADVRDGGGSLQDSRQRGFNSLVVKSVSDNSAGLIHDFDIEGWLYRNVVALERQKRYRIVEGEDVCNAKGLGQGHSGK